jgi:low affinity Fe/Cu permease
MSRVFARIANRAATLSGHYLTFLLAALVILVWAVTGPLFGFSDTWQLVINTGTTIVTFLMVFLIQNTQNRDALAVHLKLDELIKSLEEADNRLMAAEDETDEALLEMKQQYQAIIEKDPELQSRLGDSSGVPEQAAVKS